MQRLLIAVPLALALLLGAPAGHLARRCLAAELTLEDLIDLVRQHELLYENIDVQIVLSIEAPEAPNQEVAVPGRGGVLKFVKQQTTDYRFVAQGDLYSLEIGGDTRYPSGEKHMQHELSEYDGQRSRSLSGKIANVRNTRARIHPLRPHALFLRMLGREEPFSVFLAGQQAIDSYLSRRRSEHDAALTLEYRGPCERNGETCHEVWCILRSDAPGSQQGTVLEQSMLWLSEQRHWMPVEMLSYDLQVSTTVPIAEAKVTSWLEVEQGIWFPRHAELHVLKRDELRESGRRVLAWRHLCDVKSVSLYPNYPISFFRRAVFPEGTLVYEFENNKRTRAYRVGSPADPNLRRSGVLHPQYVWLLVAIAGASMLALFLRPALRRRRNQRVQARMQESNACSGMLFKD